MSACAKRQYGTRAQKATLYKIEGKVVKINQAIHDVFRGLYFTYCLGSRLNSPKASNTSLGGLAILAQLPTQNLAFFKNGLLVRIELRGAIVELAPKSKIA